MGDGKLTFFLHDQFPFPCFLVRKQVFVFHKHTPTPTHPDNTNEEVIVCHSAVLALGQCGYFPFDFFFLGAI